MLVEHTPHSNAPEVADEHEWQVQYGPALVALGVVALVAVVIFAPEALSGTGRAVAVRAPARVKRSRAASVSRAGTPLTRRTSPGQPDLAEQTRSGMRMPPTGLSAPVWSA